MYFVEYYRELTPKSIYHHDPKLRGEGTNKIRFRLHLLNDKSFEKKNVVSGKETTQLLPFNISETN